MGVWGQAVQQRQVLELDYQRLKGSRDGAPHGRAGRHPVFGVLFLSGRVSARRSPEAKSFENPEDPYPTIYRIDRIRAFRATGEHFTPAYAKRFQEGEFRRRVQFMYGGKLQKIRFKYTGPSIEAVLDRLPTAEILSQDDSGWTISAEVFGKGIEMWMRSQGDYIQEIHEKEKESAWQTKCELSMTRISKKASYQIRDSSNRKFAKIPKSDLGNPDNLKYHDGMLDEILKYAIPELQEKRLAKEAGFLRDGGRFSGFQGRACPV